MMVLLSHAAARTSTLPKLTCFIGNSRPTAAALPGVSDSGVESITGLKVLGSRRDECGRSSCSQSGAGRFGVPSSLLISSFGHDCGQPLFHLLEFTCADETSGCANRGPSNVPL